MSRPERLRTLSDDPFVIRGTLHGYERVLVPNGVGRWINIVVPAPGKRVDGVVLLGLDSWDFTRLDGREGVGADVYRREMLDVVTPLHPRPRKVWVYTPGSSLLRTYKARKDAQSGKVVEERRAGKESLDEDRLRSAVHGLGPSGVVRKDVPLLLPGEPLPKALRPPADVMQARLEEAWSDAKGTPDEIVEAAVKMSDAEWENFRGRIPVNTA